MLENQRQSLYGSVDGDDEDEDDDGTDRGRWIHTGATWSSNISFRVL